MVAQTSARVDRRTGRAARRGAALLAEAGRPTADKNTSAVVRVKMRPDMTTLAAWASGYAVPEAYRVTRLPSSHGGVVGWQLTLWRAREAWCAARVTQDLGEAVPAP